jgi:hypothetical protein
VNGTKYVGLDVHTATISIAVLSYEGKLIMESVIEAKGTTVIQFIEGLRGELFLTFEEGTWSAWLYDLLTPHVTNIWSVIRVATPCSEKAVRTTVSMRANWLSCCARIPSVRSITEKTACAH